MSYPARAEGLVNSTNRFFNVTSRCSRCILKPHLTGLRESLVLTRRKMLPRMLWLLSVSAYFHCFRKWPEKINQSRSLHSRSVLLLRLFSPIRCVAITDIAVIRDDVIKLCLAVTNIEMVAKCPSTMLKTSLSSNIVSCGSWDILVMCLFILLMAASGSTPVISKACPLNGKRSVRRTCSSESYLLLIFQCLMLILKYF